MTAESLSRSQHGGQQDPLDVLLEEGPQDPYAGLIPSFRTQDYQGVVKKFPSWDDLERQAAAGSKKAEAHMAALRASWAAGDLSYKLDPEQLKAYHIIRSWIATPTRGKRRRGLRFVLDVSRRWGKSSLSLLIATEERLKNTAEKRIVMWCDTREQAEKIAIGETYHWLFHDAPPEFKPKYFSSSYHSLIWTADDKNLRACRKLEIDGLDEDIRGGSLYCGIVDEAAMVPKLEYILDSVIDPMMLGKEGSFLLIASTPPPSPSHYFSSHLVRLNKTTGEHFHATIFDNPRLSTEEILLSIAAKGGIESPTVQREYLARHIPDATKVVFPEAEKAITEGNLIWDAEQLEEPAYRNCYVAMDPGYSDQTGLLFSWVDFENGQLVVEDEYMTESIDDQPSSKIAQVIKDKEHNLWFGVRRFDTGLIRSNPHMRWTDISHRLRADMAHDHDLHFSHTLKSDLHLQVNTVRNWILGGRIKIHPRCEKLLSQLRACIWANETRREFKREKGHHYDLCAALVYLVRGVEPLLALNPNPPANHNPLSTTYLKEPANAQDRSLKARLARQNRRVERLNAKRNRGR